MNSIISGEFEYEVYNSICSVEVALSQSTRLLIRGTAGSGKTTLLQWIAVNSALKAFRGPLAKWNKMLPFYISLRSFIESNLPSPEDFPKSISSAIYDSMPKGWVRAALASGQALVLIDGLDEVSKLRREEVRRWIEDLVDVFPKAHYFVTSRPDAIEVWMANEGFNNADLLPMELSDIYAFIDHWHDAVKEELNDELEIIELPFFAQHLKKEVECNRPLRNLATNPLLCAMLCALNRERREQLPLDRIKLYEACCEMLIEPRDKDRQFPSLIILPPN